jgi:hypothetical protein
VPPAPPPSIPPATGDTVGGATGQLPTLDDFADPNSARARQAFLRAKDAFNDRALTNPVRAQMGLYAAQYQLDKKNRSVAAFYIRQACRLSNLGPCAQLLDQVKDVVPR